MGRKARNTLAQSGRLESQKFSGGGRSVFLDFSFYRTSQDLATVVIKHQLDMRKRKFQIGDKVLVIGLPSDTYAPGVKDELGTERLLKSMLGKVYRIMGYGKYGLIELQPTRRDTIWMEPQFLKLRSRKGKDGAKVKFR